MKFRGKVRIACLLGLWMGCATGAKTPGNGAGDAGVQPTDAASARDSQAPTSDAAPLIDALVPDAPASATGHPAAGSVSGSVTASSPNYRLIGTMRSGDNTGSSPNYQYRGGIVGGSQP